MKTYYYEPVYSVNNNMKNQPVYVKKSLFKHASDSCRVYNRPSIFQSITIEPSTTLQSNLVSELIELKSITFQEKHILLSLPAVSSSVLQPTSIYESLKI